MLVAVAVVSERRITLPAQQLPPQEVDQVAVAVALSNKRETPPSPIATELMALTPISHRP
jgi:hypothetical protein